MTGLEKIVSAIRREAQAEAEKTVGQAKAEAARILADEKAKSDDLCAGIEEEAGRQAADIERAAASAAELTRRRSLLQTKQDLISQTIEQALGKLYALPVGAYFDLLLSMAVSGAEPGTGELLLCERDLLRCPEDFRERLQKALPEGAMLSVSDKPRPIDGGFILKYGDIEQNCSFKAVFDARRDELTDRVSEILFS